MAADPMDAAIDREWDGTSELFHPLKGPSAEAATEGHHVYRRSEIKAPCPQCDGNDQSCPRCEGWGEIPADSPENIVRISPREHRFAHGRGTTIKFIRARLHAERGARPSRESHFWVVDDPGQRLDETLPVSDEMRLAAWDCLDEPERGVIAYYQRNGEDDGALWLLWPDVMETVTAEAEDLRRQIGELRSEYVRTPWKAAELAYQATVRSLYSVLGYDGVGELGAEFGWGAKHFSSLMLAEQRLRALPIPDELKAWTRENIGVRWMQKEGSRVEALGKMLREKGNPQPLVDLIESGESLTTDDLRAATQELYEEVCGVRAADGEKAAFEVEFKVEGIGRLVVETATAEEARQHTNLVVLGFKPFRAKGEEPRTVEIEILDVQQVSRVEEDVSLPDAMLLGRPDLYDPSVAPGEEPRPGPRDVLKLETYARERHEEAADD